MSDNDNRPMNAENSDIASETEEFDDFDESPKPKKSPHLKTVNDIFDIVELFVICAAVILTLFTFIARPTIVQGESMENTLLEGDALLVTSFCGSLSQGDIIVAQNVSLPLYPEPIVKRVIATEGQVLDIDFTTWTVTVDGVELPEPYRKVTQESLRTSDWTYPMQIPEGYLFVMGDNRNHSADSRCADIGLIDERCVVGRALCRIFPFTRITAFD